MKYGLNDKPGPLAMALYGLQWWVVSLPCVVILGLIVTRLHYSDIAMQTFAMRKLFALTGVVTVVQVLWGHRLPLVVGPASILLVGLVASSGAGIDAVYTAIGIGGAVLALAAGSGLLTRLRAFFTPRIVTVVLVLLALSMSPTILRLVFSSGTDESFHLAFALSMVAALLIGNTLLRGVAKSLTVILGVAGGTLCYFLLQGFPPMPTLPTDAASPAWLISSFDPDPGTVLSFLFCFLALTINEVGSVESIGHLLKADNMAGRTRRGAVLQGAANMAAGSLGVIGPVDYSLSAGVIAATGCASRYALVPAGLGLLFCAFFPRLILLLSCLPGVVMGALMLYLMASQIASGLSMLVAEKSATDFNSGITLGMPLMIALLVAFAPETAFDGFPELLRPIIGNGFVMGAIAVIALEHGLFRKKTARSLSE